MRTTRAVVGTAAVAAAVGLVVSSVGGAAGGPPSSPDDPVALPEDLELVGALTAFDSCDDYLAHVREHALEQVGPYGLHGGGIALGEAAMDGMADDGDRAMADPQAEMATAGDDAAGSVVADNAAPDHSGTNVQEEGVDEPDHVKTDGRWLYTVRDGTLHVVDLQGEDPEVVTTVRLGDSWGEQLLLHEDRLLVTSPATDQHLRSMPGDAAADIWPGPGGYGHGTTLRVFDVADPSDPTERESLTLDGSVLSSRLIDGTVRLVVRAEPTGLAFTYPEGGGLRAERAALEANREVVRTSTADQWIPYFVHETAGGRAEEGTLVPCERIARPDAFSGLSTVTVLSIDLGGVLRPEDGATAVLGGGETVYASRDRLYVSTTRWQEPDWGGAVPLEGSTVTPTDDITIIDETGTTDEATDTEDGDEVDAVEPVEPARPAPTRDQTTTELHAFDLSDPRRAPHVASGAVPGRLLNQWAMSEHEGVLRVATTTGDPWSGVEPSQSRVTTLTEDNGVLAELGRVDGLGVTETIHAVRFIGEVGYVVTFREIDPLYTIDLSDPSDPRELGELKIPGFSNYLHPIGDGLLLGIGQDADEETGMTEGGQVSLFDVSDLTDPRRIDTLDLGEGWSPVQDDHRAFLHWAPTGLSVVPFESWSHDPEDLVERNGAVAFTADRGGIDERRRISHAPLLLEELDEVGEADESRLWDLAHRGVVDRSVVVGDQLLTLSYAGLAVHDLDTLEDIGWAPWR